MPDDRYSVLADQIILKVKLNGKHKVPVPQTSAQITDMIHRVVADDATVLARDAALSTWQKSADRISDLVDELLNTYRQLAEARGVIIELAAKVR
jgi:hypothetical protein